jgi:hypothetical protein
MCNTSNPYRNCKNAYDDEEPIRRSRLPFMLGKNIHHHILQPCRHIQVLIFPHIIEKEQSCALIDNLHAQKNFYH